MTTTYDLRISDYQRARLLDAVAALIAISDSLKKVGLPSMPEAEQVEVTALYDMLAEAVPNTPEPICNDFTL